jgi:hypothetical protein
MQVRALIKKARFREEPGLEVMSGKPDTPEGRIRKASTPGGGSGHQNPDHD